MDNKTVSFTQTIPVAWGEMDALQHVNNTVYFRYFETARINYFKQINLMETLAPFNLVPVISETSCKYKAPVTFPDTLQVTTYLQEITQDTLIMGYEIFSEKLQRITTTGLAHIVIFDSANKTKVKIPETLHQRITHLAQKLSHEE